MMSPGRRASSRVAVGMDGVWGKRPRWTMIGLSPATDLAPSRNGDTDGSPVWQTRTLNPTTSGKLQGLRRGVQVEVAGVVGDLELVADEVVGGQVQDVGVHQRQHPGAGGQGIDPVPGESDGGGPAGAAVDHDRHAPVHTGLVGPDAEVAQARIHVGVQVDQSGCHEQPGRVDHLHVVGQVVGSWSDGQDGAAADQDVGDQVEAAFGVDDPPAAQDQVRRRGRRGVVSHVQQSVARSAGGEGRRVLLHERVTRLSQAPDRRGGPPTPRRG